MKVEIAGKEYAFEVNGTVGLLYLAERMLEKGEVFDASKPHHIFCLFYSILASSNKEAPDVVTIASNMTRDKMQEWMGYVNKRFLELDPPQKSEDKEGDEKNA